MHMGKSYSEMQILWLDCVDGQADLNLTAIRNKLFFSLMVPILLIRVNRYGIGLLYF